MTGVAVRQFTAAGVAPRERGAAEARRRLPAAPTECMAAPPPEGAI